MCGIVGIYSHQPVAPELYDSLIHLQHRGQDAAGILTADQQFYIKSGSGLVQEIFTADNILPLKGHIGIGHARYPTAGGYNKCDIQPLWLEQGNRTIALAHNGNLLNYQHVIAELCEKQNRQLSSTLDSEALLLMLADGLSEEVLADEDEEQFFAVLCEAIARIFNSMEGAYSVISLVLNKGLIAFRDPHGIRPLVWGSRANPDGVNDIIFASETTPFYALGFTSEGDILPGEVVFVSQTGKLYRRLLNKKEFRPCVFEYVYFARPDSTIDNVSVYRARLRMGQNLGVQWRNKYPDLLPDVVIPAPFTANTAALSFAHALGVRYSEGLYKNPFIGRTFIMPNQTARKRNIRYKLTPQRTEIENKVVLIVDDSIVRGTTSREIVKMVREFGARKIYFVSTSPPLKNPCFYGIDIPTRDELIAAHKTDQEIADFIGVDALLYQTQDDLIEAVTRRGKHHITRPCMACMDGDYVCGKITNTTMQQLEQLRNQSRSVPVEHKEDLK